MEENMSRIQKNLDELERQISVKKKSRKELKTSPVSALRQEESFIASNM